ncbi:MAG: prepilin-type N-terminal cleavage/methylation domain-containing protein [Gallionella sp.]|nr:MAG: prepilin-type N-terminal cleavage/methylation domain-containing protein [Gallionella sp.]
MGIRGQKTEDGRQMLACRAAARIAGMRGTAATKLPPSDRGFTLIELVVVIIIVVVVMGLFLNRALYYQEQAEKVAMEEVAGAVQSALTMQYGRILVRGNPSDAAALVRDNPMNWLQKPPHNYAGEFYAPTPLAVDSGNWVFDLKSRELLYVPRNAGHFKPGKDGEKWIRFHVAMSYEAPRAPSLQNASPELTGVLFEPVEPYMWF